MYRFFGKITREVNHLEMRNPVFDEVGKEKNTGKIMPIYPSTYKLSQTAIRQAVENALLMIKGEDIETLPEYILKSYNLEDLQKSLQEIHSHQILKIDYLLEKDLYLKNFLLCSLHF